MSYEIQLEFLVAQAAYADDQASKAADPHVKDTWIRVSKSCHYMASLYRKIGGNELPPVDEK